MESIKEIFRIGKGPSSSHTMGPQRAAKAFAKRYPKASRFEVTLYGSLAATGKGHMTDQAIEEILQEIAPVKIIWRPDIFLTIHPNGMEFKAFDENDNATTPWIVYSIGGGALSEGKGSKDPFLTPQIYPLSTISEIKKWCERTGCTYWEYVEQCEGPKITMSAKFGSNYNIGDKRYVPGPGQYNSTNTNNYRIKYPAYRIGTAKRRGLYNSMENPGPGQYGPDNCINNVRPKTPAWKIGTGLRPELNPGDKTTPGVGNYNITKGMGDGPKYSMVGKGNPYGISNNNPGPGQYNDTYGITKIKNPSWKIGTGQRDDELKRIKREGYPGPGMYEYDDKTKTKAPLYRFGHEKRGENKKSDTPGPGQYKIPCSFDDVNEYTRQQGIFDKNFKFV